MIQMCSFVVFRIDYRETQVIQKHRKEIYSTTEDKRAIFIYFIHIKNLIPLQILKIELLAPKVHKSLKIKI